MHVEGGGGKLHLALTRGLGDVIVVGVMFGDIVVLVFFCVVCCRLRRCVRRGGRLGVRRSFSVSHLA